MVIAMALSTVFADPLKPIAPAGERHVKTVFVSTLPDDYDPEIADAFARLGAEYDDLAARLSEGDPAFEARFPSGAAER